MTDWARLLVAFAAAVNPAAVALALGGWAAWPRNTRVIAACAGLGVGLAVLVVVAGAADSLLDFLDIQPETFRIAAGIVMLATGALAVVRGGWPAPPEGADAAWRAGLSPLGLPLLAGPAAIVAAASYGADEGVGTTVAAFALPLLAGAALAARPFAPPLAAFRALAAITGALLVVVAVGLIVSGVRDI